MNYQGMVEEDVRIINSRVCAECGQTFGKHAYLGDNCPSNAACGPLYLETRFTDDMEIWYARSTKGA